MKFKKFLICFIISISILLIATNSFALSLKKKKALNNETNTISNAISDEIEEKEEIVENTIKNEIKKDLDIEETNKKETKKSSKTKIINSDVYSGSDEESIEYNNIKVNGNMFVCNSRKITLNNVKVNGNIFLFGDKIEIADSEIEGSVYTAGNEISFVNSDFNSVYAAASNIDVVDSVISRDLRAAGKSIIINAEVERSTYIAGQSIEVEEDAKLYGKTYIAYSTKNISEDAVIDDAEYEYVDEKSYGVNVDLDFLDSENKTVNYFSYKGVEIVIIIMIAIFVICGSPKFTEVNSCLRLRDFVKAFFTGLLEIVVTLLIIACLFCTFYGIGYGLLLLNLLIVFMFLGKILFIISFAIRISCKPDSISKVKAILSTGFVALVLVFVEMISIIGEAGIGIDFVFNVILAITGFGSMFRVIFTSKKKIKETAAKKVGVKKDSVVNTPIVQEKEDILNKEENKNVSIQEELKTEIKEEVKEEIKQEIEELKKENEEEKELNNNDNENKE